MNDIGWGQEQSEELALVQSSGLGHLWKNNEDTKKANFCVTASFNSNCYSCVDGAAQEAQLLSVTCTEIQRMGTRPWNNESWRIIISGFLLLMDISTELGINRGARSELKKTSYQGVSRFYGTRNKQWTIFFPPKWGPWRMTRLCLTSFWHSEFSKIKWRKNCVFRLSFWGSGMCPIFYW